jgi:hypothetical protein
MAVHMALVQQGRGLTGTTSLASLLADKRGVLYAWNKPDLTIETILRWADDYHDRNGSWPNKETGPIAQAPEETWCAVNEALRHGRRSLIGRSTLAELLSTERGVRNRAMLPKLTRRQILRWADAHHKRTGEWPTQDSGPIVDAPAESWAAVDSALNRGSRGLRGESSLAQLLAAHRGRQHYHDRPPLSGKKILAWAEAHFEATGQWPTVKSGPVHDAPEENWSAIDAALRVGSRGLPGDSSLRYLLAKKKGVRNPSDLPPLTAGQIMEWAAMHQKRTGHWPKYQSGPIDDAPGETWASVDHALRYGTRTLQAGQSLAKLLAARQATLPEPQEPENSSLA